jgi:hypothetical protein
MSVGDATVLACCCRRAVLFWGVILVSASTVAFAAGGSITNRGAFVAVCVVLRIISGRANGFLAVCWCAWRCGWPLL